MIVVPIAGSMSSACCYASQIIRRQQEDDSYWNSLSKEEKIIKAELSYYRWKEEQELKEYQRKYKEKLLRIEKRKKYIKIIKEFIYDNFSIYFEILSYKFFNLKINYFIFIPIEFYQYLYIYEPIKKINLNDLDIVARILKSTHNCNFNKVKKLIYFKFKKYEDRKQYLEMVYNSIDIFNENEKNILNKIFKIKE